MIALEWEAGAVQETVALVPTGATVSSTTTSSGASGTFWFVMPPSMIANPRPTSSVRSLAAVPSEYLAGATSMVRSAVVVPTPRSGCTP